MYEHVYLIHCIGVLLKSYHIKCVHVNASAGSTWRGQLTVVGALDHLEDGLTAAIHPPRVAVVRDPVPKQAHVQAYMTHMPKVAVV